MEENFRETLTVDSNRSTLGAGAPTIAHAPDFADAPKASERTVRPTGARSQTTTGFSKETEALFGVRLQLLTAVFLIQGMITLLLSPVLEPDWLFIRVRIACLLAYGAALVVLRRNPSLSFVQLRRIEVAVLSVVIGHLCILLAKGLIEYAWARELGRFGVIYGVFLGAFTLLICMYGMFMPNPWPRTLIATTLMALTPGTTLAICGYADRMVLAATDSVIEGFPSALPMLAIIAAVAASHTVHKIRRQAYDAKQLNQYRLHDLLGKGGMGEVYVAEHRLLKRTCAIKLIRSEQSADEDLLERFEREVRATAKLTHPNTVEVFDYGYTAEGVFYYVMELLPGCDLNRLVKEHGPQPPERVVHVLKQCCGALGEAHSKELIHRDLKPGNIFLTERGGMQDVVKIIDYGLVRVGGPLASEKGSLSGSPLFMCPEQSVSFESVDARGDLYALGCIAYFMISGQPPFQGRTLSEVLRAHCEQEPVPVSTSCPEVSEELNSVVLKCLAKDPAERFQSALELSQALASVPEFGRWTEEKAFRWWSKKSAPIVAR